MRWSMGVHKSEINFTSNTVIFTDTQHRKATWETGLAAEDKTVGWYFQQGLVYDWLNQEKEL